FTLAVAPWAGRNAIVLGTPTFLSTEGGAGMYVGTRPDSEQIWEEGLKPFLESDEVRAIIGDEYYISAEADARFRAAALEWILGHPVETFVHGVVQVAKAWAYLPGARTVARDRPWLWPALVGIPVAALALALYGATIARSRVLAALVIGMPAYYSLLLVPLLAVPRHLLPLFPLIAIGAMVGLARVAAQLVPDRVGAARWGVTAGPERTRP